MDGTIWSHIQRRICGQSLVLFRRCEVIWKHGFAGWLPYLILAKQRFKSNIVHFTKLTLHVRGKNEWEWEWEHTGVGCVGGGGVWVVCGWCV